MLASTFRWVMTTPLGSDVAPDVNTISAVSPGRGRGGRGAARSRLPGVRAAPRTARSRPRRAAPVPCRRRRAGAGRRPAGRCSRGTPTRPGSRWAPPPRPAAGSPRRRRSTRGGSRPRRARRLRARCPPPRGGSQAPSPPAAPRRSCAAAPCSRRRGRGTRCPRAGVRRSSRAGVSRFMRALWSTRGGPGRGRSSHGAGGAHRTETPMLAAIRVWRGDPGCSPNCSTGLMAKNRRSSDSATFGVRNHRAPPP